MKRANMQPIVCYLPYIEDPGEGVEKWAGHIPGPFASCSCDVEKYKRECHSIDRHQFVRIPREHNMENDNPYRICTLDLYGWPTSSSDQTTDVLTMESPAPGTSTAVPTMYSPASATTTRVPVTRPVPVAARFKRSESARRKTRYPPKRAQPKMRRRPCESAPALDAVAKILDGVFGNMMATWAFNHFSKPAKWPIDEQMKLIHNIEKVTMLHYKTIYNGENTELLE